MKKMSRIMMRVMIATLVVIFAIVSALIIAQIAGVDVHIDKKGHISVEVGKHPGISVEKELSSDIVFMKASEDDLLRAKVWAERRRMELSPSDENYKQFGYVLEDIKNGNIRYSIDDPSGTHISSILCYAKAQGTICRAMWKSNITSYEGHGEWMGKSDVINAVAFGNERHPDINHWVECK